MPESTRSESCALEKAKEEKFAQGEIETHHPGFLGAQDTYYVGYIHGVGKIFQQTFIDTYSKVAFAKLYDRKIALTAAEMHNDKVVPFYELLRDTLDARVDRQGNRVLRSEEASRISVVPRDRRHRA
jgi:hypothetical protein